MKTIDQASMISDEAKDSLRMNALEELLREPWKFQDLVNEARKEGLSLRSKIDQVILAE